MQEEQQFATQMAHLARAFRSELDRRLQPTGLSQARWLVLWYLMRNDTPPTQRELANLIGIESPTLARTLDALEEKQLIRRDPCQVDRRIKRVLLTPQASKITSDIESIANQLRTEVFQDIDPELLKQCHQLHKQLLRNLESVSIKTGS